MQRLNELALLTPRVH